MRKLAVAELVDSIPTETTNYTFNASFHEVKSIQVTWASTTAAFSFRVYRSNDGVNFATLGNAQAIADDSGSEFTTISDDDDYLYYRVVLTKTSGALTDFKISVANLER